MYSEDADVWHPLMILPISPLLRNATPEPPDAQQLLQDLRQRQSLQEQSQRKKSAKTKLRSRFTPKPRSQSASNFNTISVGLRSISLPKDSFRFAAKRPVDVLFRFRAKTAPTPNGAEPRALLQPQAAYECLSHRGKISAPYLNSFARYAASKIAPTPI